jgi:DNA (cytosine-5)-methyltransferase 1
MEPVTRPRLLDLFCCAGGAAVGYHRAGFDVVGVDIEPQPRYPFDFHHADAMTFPLDGFDVIHASPPCQAYSSTRHTHSNEHPMLVDAVRARLAAFGLPWVIENVEGAPMRNALTLCGTEFGLRSGDRWLRRHRLFESSIWLMGAGGCNCSRRLIGGVYGHAGGGGGAMARGFKLDKTRSLEAMGTPWMNRREVSQAIPPAYTEFIGEQLIAHLAVAA